MAPSSSGHPLQAWETSGEGWAKTDAGHIVVQRHVEQQQLVSVHVVEHGHQVGRSWGEEDALNENQ